MVSKTPEQKQMDELKRRERSRSDIQFTSAEEFCGTPSRVWCSRKMNFKSRTLAIARLKYMSSIMCIVDHYRTHMSGRRDQPPTVLLERDYDLSNGEDVMALAAHFPFTMQHWFLLNLELIADRCFEGV